MGSFSIKTFGVGDGWPCDDRNHSSTLIDLGEEKLLIDCGEPVSRSFKASGLDYNLLDRIFISHYHFDHIGGFFMFMQGCWLEKRTRDLQVHAPVDGLDLLQKMLNAGCVFKELLPFDLSYHAIKAQQSIEWGSVKVTPVLTTHLQSLQNRFQANYPDQTFEAFSFLIEKPGIRIVHSGDIGSPQDLEPLLEKPVDLLICELAHFSLEDIASFLRPRSIRNLCFIHIGRRYHENLDETWEQLRILLGRDDFKLMKDNEKFEIQVPSLDP